MAIRRPPPEALVAPAAERNKGPILSVLERVLPQRGLVLEIASGTGQHVAHFARTLPGLTWQPSERDAPSRRSIVAWIAHTGLTNVRPPLDLDVRVTPWPVEAAEAIVCINMIHIAPWAAALALFSGARAALPSGAPLYLYGPYMLNGRHTAASNEAFDASLRAQDREWGVRDLAKVTKVADDEGFELVETVDMPANNLSVIFRKR